MANAVANGIAAAVLMIVSASIRRRCQAVVAAASSGGGKGLPACTPDAQLAAALPAIKTLVNAQVHLLIGLQPLNSCIKRSPGHRLFIEVACGGAICRWILPKRATAHMC